MNLNTSLTLKDLILVRFVASGPNGLTTSEIGKSLKGLAATTLSVSDWKRDLTGELSELSREGQISTIGKSRYGATDSGTRSALSFLGLTEISDRIQWSSIRNTYLLSRALGLPTPTNDKDRQRLATADGLRGAILATRYQLPTGPYPTITEARNALLWQHLTDTGLAERVRAGLPALMQKAFTQGSIMALLLNDMLEADRDLDWSSALKQLVAKVVDAKRTDPNELRLAVLRGSLADVPATTKQETFDLSAFSHEVKGAARASRTGRFGESKVFISHVWDQLRASGRDFGLSREQFKERLTEANSRALLRLSRADLAQSLDQDDVAASETKYLTATFHFVRLS